MSLTLAPDIFETLHNHIKPAIICHTGAGRYPVLSSTSWIPVFTGTTNNSIPKSKMISRRQGGGDEAYCTYVEEADDDANKDSALI
jgi:hypothetical protein